MRRHASLAAPHRQDPAIRAAPRPPQPTSTARPHSRMARSAAGSAQNAHGRSLDAGTACAGPAGWPDHRS